MKKMRTILSLTIITVFTLILSACDLEEVPTVSAHSQYITIDINPSVALLVDDNDIVTTAHPLNEDGELLLVDLELEGLALDVALEQVIDLAIDLGFIDPEAEETIVEVDVVGTEEDEELQMTDRVRERVGKVFRDRDIPGHARGRIFDEDFIEQANELNVSPKQYRLMQAALAADPTLSIDEAKALDMQSIMATIKEHKTNLLEVASSVREEFLSNKKAIHDTYQPLIQELEEQIEALELEGEDTSALTLELETLKEERKELMMAELESFKTQSRAIKEEMREFRQERMNEHRERVESFRNKQKAAGKR